MSGSGLGRSALPDACAVDDAETGKGAFPWGALKYDPGMRMSDDAEPERERPPLGGVASGGPRGSKPCRAARSSSGGV